MRILRLSLIFVAKAFQKGSKNTSAAEIHGQKQFLIAKMAAKTSGPSLFCRSFESCSFTPLHFIKHCLFNAIIYHAREHCGRIPPLSARCIGYQINKKILIIITNNHSDNSYSSFRLILSNP